MKKRDAPRCGHWYCTAPSRVWIVTEESVYRERTTLDRAVKREVFIDCYCERHASSIKRYAKEEPGEIVLLDLKCVFSEKPIHEAYTKQGL
jgi:hypothetical protein